MKSSHSKFSNKKSDSGKETMSRASLSGCCCGSKISEEVEETEVKEEK